MDFEDSLKKWFYQNGSTETAADKRVCLVDASGNPIGSDDIKRIANYINWKDDCVDLGLPSGRLWAKHNLGGVRETDYGWYASWGNIDLHQEGAGYNFDLTTYNATPAAQIATDLTLENDVAHKLLGGNWRMPTAVEYQELYDNCTSSWTADYNSSGVAGRVFTSKNNGNTIFLPASGYYNGTTLSSRGSGGFYWLSSWSSSSASRCLRFDSGGAYQTMEGSRRNGFTIRPVQ